MDNIPIEIKEKLEEDKRKLINSLRDKALYGKIKIEIIGCGLCNYDCDNCGLYNYIL